MGCAARAVYICEKLGERAMEDQQSVLAINEALISRFAPLKHMYAQAREAAEEELKERLANDWAEWDALDDESQAFVLEYLKK